MVIKVVRFKQTNKFEDTKEADRNGQVGRQTKPWPTKLIERQI